jgi:hypothetical protein
MFSVFVSVERVADYLVSEHNFAAGAALKVATDNRGEVTEHERQLAAAQKLYGDAIVNGDTGVAERLLKTMSAMRGKTGKRKFTDAQEIRICGRFMAGETQAEIASSLGIHINTVKNVCTRYGVTEADRVKGKDDNRETKYGEKMRVAIAALGACPTDYFGAADWWFRSATTRAFMVATDPDFPGTDAQRSRELAFLSDAASKHRSNAEIHAARELMRADNEALDGTSGAELKPNGARRYKHSRLAKTRGASEPS